MPIRVVKALHEAATFSLDMISKRRLEEVRKTFNDRFILQVPGGSGAFVYVATHGGMVFKPWPGYGWYTRPIWYYDSHQKYSPKNWQKYAPHTWYRIIRATTETQSNKNPYSNKYLSFRKIVFWQIEFWHFYCFMLPEPIVLQRFFL